MSVLLITVAGCDKTTSDNASFSNDVDSNANTQAEKIDRLLTELDQKDEINGVVLLSENSKVIYQKGFGYANYQEK